MQNIVTEQILEDLQKLEQYALLLVPKSYYDVLSHPNIYVKDKYMNDPLEGVKTSITFL